jgi:galactokinase
MPADLPPIDTAPLKTKFGRQFGAGGRVHVIRAPGRVNLIGEHTDYNDGFVLPMAIEPHVLLACRGRDDGRVRITSTAFAGQVVEFSVEKKIERAEPAWANYCRGIAAELRAAGIPLVGMDAVIDNTLPVGGGLSSSAALEVATGLALLTLAGVTMDPQRLALIAQKGEHEYARVPAGIMDQTIVAGAREGAAMLLDCRDLSKRFVSIDANELRVVVANTMVSHELGSGEYAKRKHQCEEGVAHFRKSDRNVRGLRDVTTRQLESAKSALDDVVFRRCRHVIGENARTTDFAAQIGTKNYERAGEHMQVSHASLRDDYEVSCPELDFLAELSLQVKGVYGARMTGGGFGGCTVAIMQPRVVESYIETITEAYKSRFDIKPDVYMTLPTAGASVLE